jgi:hypothetical protein
MNDPQNLVWFVLAGVVVPTVVLALLDRMRAGDGEQTAAETGRTTRTDRDTA